MDIIDLLITIVVVTILVTIVLAIVTYVAYKLRLAREPAALGPGDDGLRYFVRYAPTSGEKPKPSESSTKATEERAAEA
jgi:hypothetical protein